MSFLSLKHSLRQTPTGKRSKVFFLAISNMFHVKSKTLEQYVQFIKSNKSTQKRHHCHHPVFHMVGLHGG